MRKTAHIPPTWWISDYHRRLAARGATHLAAWVAICTGPMSHVSGVGYLPTAEIARLIGVNPERANRIIADLEKDGLLVLDREHSIGWLVGAIELQLGSPRWSANEKWLTSTISYFESLPVSTAIDGFLARYGLSNRIPYRYPIGGVSGTAEGVSPRSSLPVSFSSSLIPPTGPTAAKNFPAQDENGLDLPGGEP